MRKQIAAANWKMNLTLQEGQKLMDEILQFNIELPPHKETVFAVPFPYLITIKKSMENRVGYKIASQNCAAEKAGAYTGEVSAAMLKSIEVDYVIIGHSERREYYNEINEVLAKKVNQCLENNLKIIFCCGEPLQIREQEKQNEYVATQLSEGLFHLSAEQMESIVMAYEPIWAIGTGKTASSQQAQDMHQYIRKIIENQYGKMIADNTSILYGGSVKASNVQEIFLQQDVDGGLVGGASLVAAEFVAIINGLK